MNGTVKRLQESSCRCKVNEERGCASPKPSRIGTGTLVIRARVGKRFLSTNWQNIMALGVASPWQGDAPAACA